MLIIVPALALYYSKVEEERKGLVVYERIKTSLVTCTLKCQQNKQCITTQIVKNKCFLYKEDENGNNKRIYTIYKQHSTGT